MKLFIILAMFLIPDGVYKSEIYYRYTEHETQEILEVKDGVTILNGEEIVIEEYYEGHFTIVFKYEEEYYLVYKFK